MKDENSQVGQASPEEVKDFLEASKRMEDVEKTADNEKTKTREFDLKEVLFKNKPKTEDMVKLEGVNASEVAKALGVDVPEGSEPEEAEPDSGHVPEPNDPGISMKKHLSKQTKTHANQMAWAANVEELGPIEVNDLEKRMFLKAVLNDENVYWDMTLAVTPENPVTVRSLFEWELSLVFSALAEDGKEGLIQNNMEYFSTLQNYSICLQIERIGNVAYKHKFQPKEDEEVQDTIKALRKHMYNHVRDMGAPQKSMVLEALRLFHSKYEMCKGKMRDQDFWTPRG